jgi:hypothetical protein
LEYALNPQATEAYVDTSGKTRNLRAYPKILSEALKKSGVEAFVRIFPVPFRNFGIYALISLEEAGQPGFKGG